MPQKVGGAQRHNTFVAEVPGLPGCMVDTKPYREILSNTEKIIEEWVETATILGRSVPEPMGCLSYV